MRKRKLIAIAATTVALCTSAGALASAAAHASTACNPVTEVGGMFAVSKSGPVTCATARGIARSFLRGHGHRHCFDGTRSCPNSDAYFTLPGYPGWTIGTGAGGGVARKGARRVEWDWYAHAGAGDV